MAKKTKKKGSGEKETVKPSDVIQVPSDNEITKAFKSLGGLTRAAKSAAGEVGSKIQKLCDEENGGHFDRKAISTVRALLGMSDARFAITWPHVKKYAEALGFDARADKQAEMFEDEGDGEPEGQISDSGNVRKLRPAREVAAENGGAEAGAAAG